MFKFRLKELRKEERMTQVQLADAIGVERSTIGKYEGNQNVVPSIEVLHTIADYFNVTTDYLLGRDNPYNLLDTQSSLVSESINDYRSTFHRKEF
jgi:transcriptional regulator with XRE-family HTH domain